MTNSDLQYMYNTKNLATEGLDNEGGGLWCLTCNNISVTS